MAVIVTTKRFESVVNEITAAAVSHSNTQPARIKERRRSEILLQQKSQNKNNNDNGIEIGASSSSARSKNKNSDPHQK